MSLIQQTTSKLYDLKLSAMAQEYLNRQQQPKLHQLNFDARFDLLVDYEASESASLENLDEQPPFLCKNLCSSHHPLGFSNHITATLFK